MFSEIGFLCNLIVLFTSIAATYDAYETLYEGAQVWQTILRTPSDVETLQKLSVDDDISIWSVKSNQIVDFLVKHENIMKVLQRLRTSDLDHKILILDVQSHIRKQKSDDFFWDDNALRNGHRLSWDRYPTPEIVDEYLDSLIQSYPSICKMHQLGRSVENRTIKMLQVSNGNPRNKAMLLVSGVHSREWAAITSLLYVINNVVSKFDQQPAYMTGKDWYFIPVLNPDGFIYSHKRDRLWRKNRRALKRGCYGIDINRNFGLDWDLRSREKKPCATSYAGPFPFSEPETNALRDWLVKSKRKPVAFADIHTYGQHIMFPWSARAVKTRDRSQHITVAGGMAKAIKAISDEPYNYGETYQLLYPATGTAMDWAYSIGVKHSYGIEGRDLGSHGFLLPPNKIEAVGTDILVAVRYLAKFLDPQLARRMDLNSSMAWF